MHASDPDPAGSPSSGPSATGPAATRAAEADGTGTPNPVDATATPPDPSTSDPGTSDPGSGPGSGPGDSRARRFRGILLALAVARYVIPIAAIPLVPLWFPDRMVELTLLRPGKEILLAAGGVYRTNGTGDPDLVLLFLAFLPLMLFSVWGFFWLGRAWQHELEHGQGPDWLARAVPPDEFARYQRLLDRRGPTFAFIGRVAGLPPTILAAAAGTSTVDTRRYLAADFAGAITSFALMVWLGFWLGEAYERAGTWFLVVAIVALFAIMSWASAWLRREPDPSDAAPSEADADDASAGEGVPRGDAPDTDGHART